MLADFLKEELGALHPGVEVVCYDVSGGIGQIVGIWEGFITALRKGRFSEQIWDEVKRVEPDGVILISFPGVNLILGKRFRSSGIPVIYLAPPQVWAWGRFRMGLLRKAADRIICLFRFEQEFFKRFGVKARYYGYPLLNKVFCKRSKEETLRHIGFKPKTKYIAFLPGSRPVEIEYHERLFVKVFALLRRRYPEFKGVMVAQGTRRLPEGLIRVNEKGRYEVIGYAQAVVVVSGTATAETAILGVPMVVCYHLPPLSRFVARLLIRLRYFSIPNLVAGEQIVPEFIEPEVGDIYDSLCRLIDDENYRGQMIEGLNKVRGLFGPSGALDAIAKDILNFLTTHRGQVEH